MSDPKPFTNEELADISSRAARSVQLVSWREVEALIAQAREANRLRCCAQHAVGLIEHALPGIAQNVLVNAIKGAPEDPAARAKRELGEWLSSAPLRQWNLFWHEFAQYSAHQRGQTVAAQEKRIAELEAEVAELHRKLIATEMRAEGAGELAALQGRVALKRLADVPRRTPELTERVAQALYEDDPNVGWGGDPIQWSDLAPEKEGGIRSTNLRLARIALDLVFGKEE